MPTVADPSALQAASARDRRRRPSGEPPPLVQLLPRSSQWYLVALCVTGALWVALETNAGLRAITGADLVVLRAIGHLRTPVLDHMFLATDHLGSPWVTETAALLTGGVLIAVRRFQHVIAYLVAFLATSFLQAVAAAAIGRPRPAGITIVGSWAGSANPSRPVAGLALVLAGAVYTLAPAEGWRPRAKRVAALLLGVFCAGRIYLAVDHPTDVFAGLAIGWAFAAVFYRWATPEEAFPVVYRRGRRAHLDISGPRGQALRTALKQQLGLQLKFATPIGLAGSAGSTPLRLTVQTGDGEELVVFAKLYATVHLRSDRLYKLTRSMLYGRLEDETPFSSVRRLVEYEDHLLRLFRDAGLPTPKPLGIAELTPEREYVIVMEYVADAEEVGRRPLSDAEIDGALQSVRAMWDAGLAHRDLKPSNVLVAPDGIRLIDLAFGAVRPSPWRQAVDLANMMLTVALAADPVRVYRRALLQFTPDEIAEAFAASRGVTVPAGLRAALRAGQRDFAGEFRSLAPARRPVYIQRWTVRRVATAAGLVGGLVITGWGLSVYVGGAGPTLATAPTCGSQTRLALVAQSVGSAAYLPCRAPLPRGWTAGGVDVARGHTSFTLRSDRAPGHPVTVAFQADCGEGGATPATPRAPGARTSISLVSISPRYRGTMFDVFSGGCISYRFDFERGPHIGLMEDLQSIVHLQSRQDLSVALRQQLGVDLDPIQ